MILPRFTHTYNLPGRELLPHREPFLFLDSLISADETGSLGEYVFAEERNDFFRGHFPDFPVVPGVVLVEAMCQSAGAGVVAGNPKYTVTAGEVIFNGKNILDMPVEQRACEGVFLGFQYPVEIPGVSIANFMRTAVNEQRKYRGLDPLSGSALMRVLKETANELSK